MFKRSPKQWFYLLYFLTLAIVALHFILNLGLTFTNPAGCYRAYTASSGTLASNVQAFYNPLQSQCQALGP
jgi:hypothetical protein